MILHLFYKEWLKTRLYATFILIVGAAIITYIYFDVDNGMRLRGAFDYMMTFMYGVPQTNPYRSLVMYLPLAAAVVVGVSQYLPEVLEKRIKLTLHLPIKNTTALYGMLAYGAILLTVVFGLIFGALFYVLCSVLPADITLQVLASVSVWILGGYAAYFMIAMISMEPSLMRQMLYMVVTFFFVKMYIIGFEHGDTAHTIIPLALLVLISITGLLYTSSRFIKGER